MGNKNDLIKIIGEVTEKGMQVPIVIKNEISKRKIKKSIGKTIKFFNDYMLISNVRFHYDDLRLVYRKWNYIKNDYDKARIVIINNSHGLFERLEMMLKESSENIEIAVKYINGIIVYKKELERNNGKFQYYINMAKREELSAEDKIACIQMALNSYVDLDEESLKELEEYKVYAECRRAIMMFEPKNINNLINRFNKNKALKQKKLNQILWERKKRIKIT